MAEKEITPSVRKTQVSNCLIDKGSAVLDITFLNDNYPYNLDKMVFRTHAKINALLEIIDQKKTVLFSHKVEQENLTEINASLLTFYPDKRYKLKITSETDCATFVLLSGKRVENATERNTAR